MREDIRVTMPPQPMVFDGRDALAPLLETAFGPDGMGEWRLVPTRANRMPAAASYLRKPGETEWRAFKFDILRCEEGGDRRDHDLRRDAVRAVRPAAGA